jgi:CRISPR-associated protein (TIGR02710 family)
MDTTKKRGLNMKALVLSLGGSNDPLIKCIKDYNPDLIYFIPSIKSANQIDEILEETKFQNEIRKNIVNDHEDLQESYLKSFEAIKELKNEGFDVSMDFTGGTKPMSAGLVLAAIGTEISYSYVGTSNDGGRDKKGLGVVKGGFEKIKKQKDPYYTYAIIELDKAKDFFNNYQFKASLDNLYQAKNKLESLELQIEANFYIKISSFYSAWDKFNDKIENERLNSYLNKQLIEIRNNEKLNSRIIKNNPNFLNQIEKNKEFLDKKISKSNRKIYYNINFYLPDLLNNAYRRIEELKFDDAVARLYRTIELISQIELYKIGLINDQRLKVNKVFYIDIEQFKEKLSENFNEDDALDIFERYCKKGFRKKNIIKLTSKNNFDLLDEFKIDFATKYINDEKLGFEVSKRNNSILAHGLEPINESMAIKLYKSVLTYSKLFCPKIEELMEEAKFPKFKV